MLNGHKTHVCDYQENIQYNLSIPNLVYSEIHFNPNKWFGPNAIYYIFHIKLPCVF